MDINTLVSQARIMVAAPSCCTELREAGQKWLQAIDTPAEKKAAKNLISVLENSVQPIDNVIAFFESDAGKDKLGASLAQELAEHAKEVKAGGGKFCDCDACRPGKMILDNKKLILK